MRAIANTVLFLCFTLGAFAQGSSAPKEEHLKISGDILSLFEKKNFAEITNYFDATVKSQLSAQQLEQVWNGIRQQFGEFKQIVETTGQRVQNMDVVTHVCEFDQATMKFQLAFNDQNQVSGIFFTDPKKK